MLKRLFQHPSTLRIVSLDTFACNIQYCRLSNAQNIVVCTNMIFNEIKIYAKILKNETAKCIVCDVMERANKNCTIS